MPIEDDSISNEQLKERYWFVTHFERVKFVVLRIFFTCVIVWFIALFAFIIYFFFLHRDWDREIGNMLIRQHTALVPAVVPKPLMIGNTGTLTGDSRTVDFFSLLQNPNSEWWVELSYQFIADGTSLATHSMTLYPQEKKYAFDIANTFPEPGEVELRFVQKKWHRMQKKDHILLAERNRFAVSDITYNGPGEIDINLSIPASSVSFTLKNLSPFSFSQASAQIIAKAAGSVVAISQIPITNIGAEEKRDLTVQWFHTFTRPDSFEIFVTAPILIDLTL